ncbi:L-asparaginase [Pantoea agglomerans]|nr:L-asparaginase [Pantoea agglomerans]TKK18218.1 L-asparaginase [Pantoea agglomerans]TKK38153.1 L-asparaginase [Pantoea agglomerans]
MVHQAILFVSLNPGSAHNPHIPGSGCSALLASGLPATITPDGPGA